MLLYRHLGVVIFMAAFAVFTIHTDARAGDNNEYVKSMGSEPMVLPRHLALGGGYNYTLFDGAAALGNPAYLGLQTVNGTVKGGVASFPDISFIANKWGLKVARLVGGGASQDGTSAEAKETLKDMNADSQAFYRFSLFPRGTWKIVQFGIAFDTGAQIRRSQETLSEPLDTFKISQSSRITPTINIGLPYQVKGVAFGVTTRYVIQKNAVRYLNPDDDLGKSAAQVTRGTTYKGIAVDAGFVSQFRFRPKGLESVLGLNVFDIGDTVLKASGATVENSSIVARTSVSSHFSTHYSLGRLGGVAVVFDGKHLGDNDYRASQKWSVGAEVAMGGSGWGGLGGAPLTLQTGLNGGGWGAGLGLNLYFCYLEFSTGFLPIWKASEPVFERIYGVRLTVDLTP